MHTYTTMLSHCWQCQWPQMASYNMQLTVQVVYNLLYTIGGQQYAAFNNNIVIGVQY